jgi:uncharacterized caspase-like protein
MPEEHRLAEPRGSVSNDGQKKALIIAISEYDKFPPLAFCKNDGKKLYEILKAQRYNIDKSNFLVGNVKYEDMRDAIRKFFYGTNVKPTDTLLFYFSGHGHLDNKGYHFLVTSEMDPKDPFDKGYPFEDLTRMIDSSDSLKKVSILDCCHAGGIKISIAGKGRGKAEKGENEVVKLGRQAMSDAVKRTIRIGQGTCVLASSLGLQQSFKMPDKEYSAFSYYVIEGLGGAAADADGHVIPEFLNKYVTERLAELPDFRRQTPIAKIEIVGKLVLAEYLKQTNSGKMIALTDSNSAAKKDSAISLVPDSDLERSHPPIIKTRKKRRQKRKFTALDLKEKGVISHVEKILENYKLLNMGAISIEEFWSGEKGLESLVDFITLNKSKFDLPCSHLETIRLFSGKVSHLMYQKDFWKERGHLGNQRDAEFRIKRLFSEVIAILTELLEKTSKN